MTTPMTVLANDDERAIRALIAQAQTAQSDPGGLLALHTSEAVIVNLAGRRVLGRDAFGAAMAAALGSSLRDVRTTVEILDIRALAPDTALASCIKTVFDERAVAADALPSTGALSYVVTKADGAWRIALAQTTPALKG